MSSLRNGCKWISQSAFKHFCSKLDCLLLQFTHLSLTFRSQKEQCETWLSKQRNMPFNIRQQCRKTTVLSSHGYLVNTGEEKNEKHINVD